MKPIKYLLAAALFALGTVACDQNDGQFADDNRPVPSDKPMQFSFGIMQNRTTTDAAYKSAFAEQDAVGVFITRHGTPLAASGNYADNLCFTRSGGTWSCPEAAELFFPADGSSLDVYAYYPFRADANPTDFRFTVDADQSGSDFYAANDLLWASDTDVFNEVATLDFTHLLTLVNVQVMRGTNTAAFDSSLAVTLHGCVPTASLDLSAGTATVVPAKASDIAMSRVESPDAGTYNYRAIVPAQTLTEGSELFSFLQPTPGNEVRFNYTTAATALTAGLVARWEITLTGKAHVYQVGDVYPYKGTPEGIVFETDADGTSGKVVGLTENPSQMRWGDLQTLETEAGVTYAGDPDKGAEATHQLIAKRHEQSNFKADGDYQVFYWIYATVNGGNADGVWYLPAKNELCALFAAASGLNYADIATEWADNVKMPQYDATAAARTAFNDKLAAAGGAKLGAGGNSYATSTELDKQHIWCIQFSGMKVSKGKDDLYPRVRPIRKF